jgi:hypothetical protein
MSEAFLKSRNPGEESLAVGDIIVRAENTVSTPLISFSSLGNGQAISDIYVLTFTNTAGTITVDVVTSLPTSKNIWAATGVSCVADDSTPNLNIVPGVSLVLSSGIMTGWKATVSIGAKMTSGGVTTDIFNQGIISAGSTGTQRKIAAVNVGGEDAADSSVVGLPGPYFSPKSSVDYVKAILPHTNSVRQHFGVDAVKTITFTNWQDGTGADAGFKTCDIRVDGIICITTALFDGVSKYEYGHARYDDVGDLLRGFYITLQLTTSDPTSASITLTIRDDLDYIQLAPDNLGVPGAWQTTPLTLTESGQPSGVIRSSQYTYYWQNTSLPDNAVPGAVRSVVIRYRSQSI